MTGVQTCALPISVQQGALLEMGKDLSFEEAALNEPFACVYNGYVRCETLPGDFVLIVGAGPIGFMHMQMSRLAGAVKIIMADINDKRLELASKLGADNVINTGSQDLVGAVMELTDNHGADLCITACPIPEVQEQALELAADHGRINFFGGLPKGKETIKFDSNLLHYKELVVTGSHGCSTYHCQKALDLQNGNAINLKPIATNFFKLSEIEKAFETAMNGEGLKSIIYT